MRENPRRRVATQLLVVGAVIYGAWGIHDTVTGESGGPFEIAVALVVGLASASDLVFRRDESRTVTRREGTAWAVLLVLVGLYLVIASAVRGVNGWNVLELGAGVIVLTAGISGFALLCSRRVRSRINRENRYERRA
jgi:hypothetical protein